MNNQVIIENYKEVWNYIKAKESLNFAKKSPSFKNITYLHNVNTEPNVTFGDINELIDYAYENKLKVSIIHCN